MNALASFLLWNTLVVTLFSGTLLLISTTRLLRARPALRHALWLLLFVKLVTPSFIPIAILPPRGAEPLSHTPSETRAAVTSPQLADFSGAAGPLSSTADPTQSIDQLKSRTEDNPGPFDTTPMTVGWIFQQAGYSTLCSIAVLVALTGSLLFCVRALCHFRKLERLMDNKAETGALADDLLQIAQQLGITKLPPIHVVNGSVLPLLIVSRQGPVIILPEQLANQLSRHQIQCIFGHELAHYLRRDHWTNLFTFMVAALYWWNPLVWLARRELRQAQEMCCDALVVSCQGIGRRDYAEALFLAIDHATSHQISTPVLASGFGSFSMLTRRLEMLGNRTVAHRISWPVRLSLIALLSILYCMPTRGEAQQRATEDVVSLVTTTEDAKEPEPEILPQIIEGISRNYAQLKTVRGTLESLLIQPDIEKRETHTYQKAGGGQITTTTAPVFIRRSNFMLRGDDLRIDLLERAKDEWTTIQITTRRADTWTFFHPAESFAMIRRTAEIGSFTAIDPRELGGRDQRHGLLDQLRRSRVVAILEQSPKLRIRCEIAEAPSYGYYVGQQFTYTLDPARNFLPLEVLEHVHDGTINVVTAISYDEIIPQQAWFMRDANIKFFKTGTARDSASDKWTQMLAYRLVGDLKVNEDIQDEAFAIDIPPGVKVSRNQDPDTK